MFAMIRTLDAWRRGAVLATVLLLGACGGGGAPEQEPLQKTEVVGAVYDNTGQRFTTAIQTAAKGATGVERTSNGALTNQQYAVSVSGLTPPYLIRAVNYTFAFGVGTADTTPLSSLLVGGLFGSLSQSMFDAYGPNSDLPARVTSSNLDLAQRRVVAFLSGPLGLSVPANVGSLLGPVRAQAGDPLYDLLRAYGQRRSALGETAYLALEQQFLDDVLACNTEKLDLVIGSASPIEFCPRDKTATRDATDATRVEYSFTDRAGNRLVLSVVGDAVASAQYLPVSGSSFSCSGAGCAGVSLATPLGDGRRNITFAAASFTGAGGTARLNGQLLGSVPGIVLPPLDCRINRFYALIPGRPVIAECTDVEPPLSEISIAGTYSQTQGTTRRLSFAFVNANGSNGLSPSAAPPTLTAILEGDSLISLTLTRTDAATGLLDLDYRCRGSDCNGVTVGAATRNTDLGIDIDVRELTLDGTRLSAVQADGSVSATDPAVLTGVFRAIDIVATLDNGMLNLPADCAGVADAVLFTVTGETVTYGFCPDFGFAPASTQANTAGGLSFTLQTGNTLEDAVVVQTDAAGAVTRVEMNTPSYRQRFACTNTADCSGVVVSAPDGAGNRTIDFSAVVLRQIEPDGFAIGERTATGSGRFIAPPP